MDLSWQKLGACWQLFWEIGKEELWFPPDNPGGPKEGKGVSGERARIRQAKSYCAECPVTQQCLSYAIQNDCVGVWGGMDTNERRAYAREYDVA